MTTLQYAQEYEGELVDELRQFFPSDLIRSCMTLKEEEPVPHTGEVLPSSTFLPSSLSPYPKYLGVDIARMGGDETVLFGITDRKGVARQCELKIFKNQRLTETTRDILQNDKLHNKIG